jgi:hypothetical protein
MVTLEQLVVELVAETKGLRAELDKATKTTSDATGKIDEAIAAMSENSQKHTGALQDAFSTMAGFVGGQAVIKAFTMAKDAIKQVFDVFVTQGIAAAEKQEDAVNRLNQSLALAGIYSRETSKELQELASSLQGVTKFGDESIIEMSALIQTLGQLDKDGLKRATAASLDLAAALGIDLNTAATLVGKAANGEVGAFGRYGIAMEKAGTKAQTFENVLKTLETRFGGSAQQQVKTFSGVKQQLANVFGDMTETVGALVTKNTALINVMGQLSSVFMKQNATLQESEQHYRVLIGEVFTTLINIVGTTVTMFDVFVRSLKVIYGVLQALTMPVMAIVSAFIALKEGVAAGRDAFKEAMDNMKANITSLDMSTETSLGNIAMGIAEMGVAAERGTESMRAGFESVVEPTNAVVEKVKELTEEEKKRLAVMQSFVDTLRDNANSTQVAYEMELENLKVMLDERLIIEDEYHDARLELLAGKQEDELRQLEEAKKALGLTDKQYLEARGQLEKKHDLEHKKMMVERQKAEERMHFVSMQGYSQFFAGLSALSESSHKGLAAIGKASAISRATIDAYLAIQNALANVPYPANIAASIGIGAQAFMNVAKISGVKLNKGGTVPGMGPNRDSVPAMLTTGEEVVNRDTAEKLRDFLDSGGNNITIELVMRDSLVEFIEAKILERQSSGTSLLVGGV